MVPWLYFCATVTSASVLCCTLPTASRRAAMYAPNVNLLPVTRSRLPGSHCRRLPVFCLSWKPVTGDFLCLLPIAFPLAYYHICKFAHYQIGSSLPRTQPTFSTHCFDNSLMINSTYPVAFFLNVYRKHETMKPANRYSGTNDTYKNSENIALITFVVFLITTFVASCIYIGLDGFLSK